MPDPRALGTKWQYLQQALLQSTFETKTNQTLFYLARVIESGEEAINRFQGALGFRPPDGTVKAKIPNLHYTQKEEECPLFYPLFPPEFVMTPAKDQVILVMFPSLDTSGDVSGNGYWIREAVRGEPVEITENRADGARFDFDSVGTQRDQFGNELEENTKSSDKYEGNEKFEEPS